ncbi:MAG: SIMPL domain-containing protein [Herbinix sp.]|nr:SIMPL domain-containing protein [Herbinix sp.]
MPNIDEQQSQNRKMTFTGRGQVSVNPDLAIIRLGVQTTGEDVTAAQSENAKISSQILAALKELGVTDIKTYQYQIEKLYDYENGTKIDRGYSVRNIMEIRTGNMGQVGVIIDTAVYNGANVVDLISFEVSHPDMYYQQALNLAIRNAYQKAKTVSTGLRIMFDPVPILITENSLQPIPYTPTYALREGAYTTPIESGSKQIEASVTVEYVY